tara:strand:+ start:8912 stop:9148 length:237 start_codon:yes stop_codon:yes gene_type:complete
VKRATVISLADRKPVPAPKLVLATGGYKLVYRSGQVNDCPGCGGRAWQVGRNLAECANEECGFALPFAPPADVSIRFG